MLASSDGLIGTIAATVAPETTARKVDEGIRDELQKGFKEQGVVADVQVISSRPPLENASLLRVGWVVVGGILTLYSLYLLLRIK